MGRCAGPVQGGKEAERLTSAVKRIQADIAGLQLLVAALCGWGGGAEGERSAGPLGGTSVASLSLATIVRLQTLRKRH